MEKCHRGPFGSNKSSRANKAIHRTFSRDASLCVCPPVMLGVIRKRKDMSRIQSIDVFRVLAIIAVISIHTSPFGGVENNQSYALLSVAINQGARFAVPFFFVISGFFFAKKIYGGNRILPTTTSYLKRLLTIWLFFSIIYILPYDLIAAFEHGALGPIKVVYWNLLAIANNPIQFIFQGTKVHLWFLVSLGISVVIASVFIGYFQRSHLALLIILSVALYGFGLLAKAYADTPIGINIDFNTRNGPFFSTVFFVMGVVLSRFELNQNYLYYGLLVLLLGYTIHVGEIYYLYSSFGTLPTSHDYVFGTLFIGLGVSMMALSNHPLLKSRRLSNIGRYTVGIYAIHFVFVDILRPIDKKISNPAWEVGYVCLVFLLSLSVTLLLSRSERLKKVFV